MPSTLLSMSRFIAESISPRLHFSPEIATRLRANGSANLKSRRAAFGDSRPLSPCSQFAYKSGQSQFQSAEAPLSWFQKCGHLWRPCGKRRKARDLPPFLLIHHVPRIRSHCPVGADKLPQTYMSHRDNLVKCIERPADQLHGDLV